MIVRDEAFFLARCLDAVKGHVDEIVIVDTGSVDDTRQIAGRYTDKVYHFDWVDDFAAARNYSLAQATGDWILVLDADELVAPGHLALIRDTIRDTPEDAFFLFQYNYNNDPLTRDWQPVTEQTRYSSGYTGYRRNPIARLFRTGKHIHYEGAVHEVIDRSLEGLRYAELEVALHHRMDDNPEKPKKERQLNYLRMIEKALARGPDGRLAASAAGVHMYFTGDYAAAIRYFRQAIDAGYEVQRNTESLAEAYYRKGDLAEARATYGRLYRGGYRSFALLTNLANLLVRAGDYHEAVTLLEQALSGPGVTEEAESRLRGNIAYLRNKLGSG